CSAGAAGSGDVVCAGRLVAAVAAVVATVALVGAVRDAAGPGAFPTSPTDAPSDDPAAGAELQPLPSPTPEATPAPAAPSRPAQTTSPEPAAPAEQTFVERALSVSPVSAPPGVYPVLSGTATSGAVVTARFAAGGETVTVTTTAATSGAWSLAPHTLVGAISVALEQSYTTPAGQTVVAAGPAVPSFTVQQLVSGLVIEIVEGSSALHLAGPANATIEVDSPVPGISGSYVLDGSGATTITMQAPKWEAGPVRFRLVSGGRTGPWASWG
ncbi:MAG: hypothetical protein EAS51_06930, partial [Microbacteriaceae bacterium]